MVTKSSYIQIPVLTFDQIVSIHKSTNNNVDQNWLNVYIGDIYTRNKDDEFIEFVLDFNKSFQNKIFKVSIYLFSLMISSIKFRIY